MDIDTPKLILYQGYLHRISLYIGTFSCGTSGGLSSGETARLKFNIKVNGTTILSFYINYDSGTESDITYTQLASALLESGQSLTVKPNDIVKVEIETDYPSGYSFTYDDINIKVLCSKIYHSEA